MHILDVIKKTTKSFPDSYEGAGTALGMSPNVLRNKVSKANETHHLSVLELIELVREAEDARVPDPYAALHTLVGIFGFQLVHEGQGRGACDLSLAEKLMQTTQKSSELGMEIISSIADGHVDPREMERITERRRELTRTAVELEEMTRGFTAPAVTPLRRVS